MNEAYDLKVGEAAARLKANVDFEVFRQELERRRELLVQSAMNVPLDSFEQYLSAQGKYQAMTEVLEMPDQLAAVAQDIREQHHGS